MFWKGAAHQEQGDMQMVIVIPGTFWISTQWLHTCRHMLWLEQWFGTCVTCQCNMCATWWPEVSGVGSILTKGPPIPLSTQSCVGFHSTQVIVMYKQQLCSPEQAGSCHVTVGKHACACSRGPAAPGPRALACAGPLLGLTSQSVSPVHEQIALPLLLRWHRQEWKATSKQSRFSTALLDCV
jgi:hypothetical protein